MIVGSRSESKEEPCARTTPQERSPSRPCLRSAASSEQRHLRATANTRSWKVLVNTNDKPKTTKGM